MNAVLAVTGVVVFTGFLLKKYLSEQYVQRYSKMCSTIWYERND